jgi:hypothetical protein
LTLTPPLHRGEEAGYMIIIQGLDFPASLSGRAMSQPRRRQCLIAATKALGMTIPQTMLLHS